MWALEGLNPVNPIRNIIAMSPVFFLADTLVKMTPRRSLYHRVILVDQLEQFEFAGDFHR